MKNKDRMKIMKQAGHMNKKQMAAYILTLVETIYSLKEEPEERNPVLDGLPDPATFMKKSTEPIMKEKMLR